MSTALTPEQRHERIVAIANYRAAGLTQAEMAVAMGLQERTLHNWIHNNRKYYKDKVPTSPKRCLCCRVAFESEGAHNRLCGPCRAGSHLLSPMAPDPGGSTGKRVQPIRSGR